MRATQKEVLSMTIEELKQMLEDGKITQEQFEAMAKAFETETDLEPQNADSNDSNEGVSPDIEKLIQSAVDRATNRLGNDNKKLREQLDKLKKAKLTVEEMRDLELKDKEADIAERERALLEKENRLYAIKSIKAAGLDDGSDTALELIDFVMADDTSEIDSKIKAFDKLVKKFVKTEVDKTFKQYGRTPQTGSKGGNTNNPYMKNTFNLSEQMKLESENPELAKQLQVLAAAGK